MNIMNVKNKKLLKKINIWIYLVPFLLITIFFSVRSYYSVQQKIAVSYEHFIEDAADAALSDAQYSFLPFAKQQ